MPPSSEQAARVGAGAAVTVEGLGVAYRTPVQPTTGTAGAHHPRLRGWWHGRASFRTVTALHDVTLDIAHGETLGVIGANGAGKSSLLRAIAGIVPPATGRITVEGDVTAMLSLDVGLNPDLTGAEHIELGGLARGLSAEQIRRRTPDIVALADIGPVLDQPVRSYSSGMRARLAFAIAVSVDPDILLLDEALSTGDAAFRRSSAVRMRELVAQAGTVVLVSHSLKAVTDLCDRVVWLDGGRVREVGDPVAVVRSYRRHLEPT